MIFMPKEKQPDRHKNPRKSVQLPAAWYAFAETLAGDEKMPLTWLIIDLLHKAGEAAGQEDMPPLPWEKPKQEDGE